jgi:hypothetical protein
MRHARDPYVPFRRRYPALGSLIPAAFPQSNGAAFQALYG